MRFNFKLSRLKDIFKISFRLLYILWQTDKVVFLGNLVAVLLPAIVPFINAYIFKLIIDLLANSLTLKTVNFNYLYLLLGILLVTSYIQRMSFSFQNYVTKILYTKFPITLYQLVLNKISSLDLEYFENSDFHDTLQKVRDNYSWRPLEFTYFLFFTAQSLLQVLIALYAILRLNVFLALLIVIISLPDLINQIVFSKFSWSIWDHNTPHRKKFSYLSYLLQDRDSIKELKIFGLRPLFLSQIKQTQENFFKDNEKIAKKEMGANTAFNFLDSLIFLGIFIYVVFEALSKKITIGDVSFYQSVITNFSDGIGGLFRNLSRIFDHSLYVKYIFDVLDIKPKITQSIRPVKINQLNAPKIEFKNVDFKYPDTQKYVLKNFSLTINPGEKVAFVGENGAGKTTLIKLLSRFYDVTGGEILINGINLKKLDLENWYRTLGILFQDFIRYEYPVKDNIYFGRVWGKKEIKSIIEASQSAGAHEMVKKFDSEYEQMLGRIFQNGLELSGGQWQKIALARAFFRNAPVLILDEPTAALDAKAESEIFNRVEKLSKDKTVIIISHRFSTVRNANKIYVIDQGKITESGTHKQLMELNGQYTTLFNLQAKGYK